MLIGRSFHRKKNERIASILVPLDDLGARNPFFFNSMKGETAMNYEDYLKGTFEYYDRLLKLLENRLLSAPTRLAIEERLMRTCNELEELLDFSETLESLEEAMNQEGDDTDGQYFVRGIHHYDSDSM